MINNTNNDISTNNRNPVISVCMSMYNASKYLRECIDSVLAQTFKNFEFLIVDDGSTDNSVEIVKSYNDSRIRLLCNKHDYIESLNLLLKEAQGKYIARMDADDVMQYNRLSIQYEYLQPIITQYFIDNKSEIWLLFLIAHSKR